MLLEQAKRIENEASVELKIEQKWHRLLIGTKGESIQKIRVKYPEVQVFYYDQTRFFLDFVLLFEKRISHYFDSQIYFSVFHPLA